MDNKKLLDDAIGALPPSTVDLDEVIVRGRRAAILRRVVSPVVGATAAAVLVVVAAVVLPAGERSDHGVATVPSETSSSVATSSTPSDTCRDLEPLTADQASQTTQRLTTAVRELVDERLVSGERLTNSPAARDSAGTAYGPLEFFQLTAPGTAGADTGSTSCEEDPYAYLAYANADIHHLTGSLTATVSRSTLRIQPCPPWSRDRLFCEASSGPNGEQILARTVREEGDSMRHIVWVNKSGTSIEITASNAAEPGTPGDPEALPLTPLDPEQLVEVALDSRIVLP